MLRGVGGWMRAAMVTVVLVVACGHGIPSNSDIAPAPRATAVLRLRVKGPGSVRATELSLDCHGSCDATVPSGTSVRLAATADPTGTFHGWDGACGGSAVCDLTITDEVVVNAEFRPSDPCAGIVSSRMGTAVSATLPKPGPRRYCDGATSDGQGNVAHYVYGMGGPPIWQLYRPEGTATGIIEASYLIPQLTGFHGYGFQTPDPAMAVWNGDGTLVAAHTVGPSPSWFFPARTGGSVVVSTDSWNCPNGAHGRTTMNLWRFDATGELRSVVDIGGEGCPFARSDGIVALSDERNNTFLAIMDDCGGFGFPADRIIARWVSPDGTPLTPWTDVAAWGELQVAPIIGGGVVLRAGDWSAVFASGSMTPVPPPAFIPQYHDVSIIHDDTAYAVVPRAGWALDHAIELYASDGTHCGTPDFPDRSALYVGADGTGVTLDPTDWCKASWWPHLLQ